MNISIIYLCLLCMFLYIYTYSCMKNFLLGSCKYCRKNFSCEGER